jgi:O-antigen ligase
MVFAWWLAATFSWARLIEILAAAFAVLTVGSFLITLALPDYAVMGADTPHEGAWGGLWGQKNQLGGYMALGVLVNLIAASIDRTRRAWWLGFAAAACALVLLSTSATSLLAMLIGVGVFACATIVQRGPVSAVALTAVAGAIGVVLACVVLLAPQLVFSAIGRDATLTGRTDIWAALVDLIQTRPWTGFGYGAFWDAAESPADLMRRDLVWHVPNAHSGWLEVAVGVGWGGVVLSAATMALPGARAALTLLRPGIAPLAIGYALMTMLYSMSESYLLMENSFFWVLFVALAAKLAGAGPSR